MKKVLNSNLIKNYILLVLYTTIIEIFFRLISNFKVWDMSLLRIFIGLNFISLILSYIFSLFSKNINKILLIIVCLFFSGYAFFQLGFNNFIGVYASVNGTSQIGAVTEYIADFFGSFANKYYLMFIPFILLLIYLLVIDKFISKNKVKKFVLKENKKNDFLEKTIFAIVFLGIIGFAYFKTLTISFMQNDLQTISNKELFKYPSVPSIVVNQFGVLGFGVLDIKSWGSEVSSDDFSFNSSFNVDNSNVSRVIDDTKWKQVIEEEDNKTLNNISNYLINQKITDYNSHTGIFEGKNLIVIMMESVNEIFLNPELYPNFYKMYSEGISFKNNYSPRNHCSTGNNEFSGMTSLYAIPGNCTSNYYRSNTYSTSLFNLFNNAGYRTLSMHDYTEQFYYRSTIHKNMGSGKYYGVEDLGIKYYTEYKNWASDEDFMKVAMDITLDDMTNPFMLWLTTVSSHQPYGFDSVEGNKYLDITKGKNYPMMIKRYMSKLKTLDNALGIMLKRLEAAGILDDTVIVLYGDHYPYAIKNEYLNYVLDYDLKDYEVERTPMTIYNSKTTPEVVEKYSSFMIITPTIANLFNLKYDPRLYMVNDIFSDDYVNAVVFDDGSWKNNLAYYNASNGSITYHTDEVMSNDEIKKINNTITGKRQISSAIIKNNYFNYLQNELTKIPDKEEVDDNTNLGG